MREPGLEEPLLIGAVSYHPRVVTVWERFRNYFAERGAPVDYLLFSNYERLVEAVLDGQVEIGWNTNTGEASSTLRGVFATVDRDRGWGPSNRGRYSNPKLDSLLNEALSTIDDKKREQLLQDASEIAFTDYGVLPLYYEISVWAMRRNLDYTARADQFTIAQFVKPRS